MKIVVEPSGASALAALLSGRIEHLPERVGVVISGGNVGLDRFRELLDPTAA
jgi:threonine dehydratase